MGFDDEQIKIALLGVLLDAHPGQLSVREILVLLGSGQIGFERYDDVLVALDDLVGHGLAHRHGNFVFASVSAVRFNELAGPSVKV